MKKLCYYRGYKNTNSYRIVADPHGYYPQVLVKKTYLFGLITISKWVRISNVISDFELYNDLNYALDNVVQCELLIQSYHREILTEIENLNSTVEVIKYITINQ